MTKENIYQKGKAKKLWEFFSPYEKWWLLVFSIAAIVTTILCPEDGANGVSGTVITIFCLISTLLCLLCELLVAKQSKWNAFIYIFVEFLEITRFLIISMLSNALVSLLFWIPIHIMTFVNWNKNEDNKKKELTKVRSLKLKDSIILISSIIVWTLVIGYLLARFMPDTGFFSNEGTKVAAAYLDACSSALAIANGLLIYLRYKESWYPWLLYSLVAIAYLILTGYYILIVLQLGYLTNAIYGYLHWSKYIKSTEETIPAKPEEAS